MTFPLEPNPFISIAHMFTTFQRSLGAALFALLLSLTSHGAAPTPEFSGPKEGVSRSIRIPTIDISGERHRQVVVAQGTEETYQGHCDTALMADGKTLFAAWCIGHAGRLGPLSRSDDGGLTWSAPLPTPEDWKEVRQTTPVLHRLKDPSGVERLFLFGGCDFPGNIRRAFSEDGGRTWSRMEATGLIGEVAPKSILPFDGGKRLVMWSDRRDPSNAKDPHPVVWQSESLDGGRTWSPERIILRVPGQWAQPSVVRSADGKRLLMLMRENTRRYQSLFSESHDGALTWSEPRELPAAVTGDRHVIKQASDGRLVVAFRDMSRVSTTYGHYVAWVGTFEDLVEGREGQYRIKLMHNGLRGLAEAPGSGNSDCGYSDIELLNDETFVATTYIKRDGGPQKHSVVSVRFTLAETDALFRSGVLPASKGALVPAGWDPALAGDVVMRRLARVTPQQAKGAHDAEFVCVGRKAYVVEHDNDVAPGHGAGAAMYCILSVVNLDSLRIEKTQLLARAGQVFSNATLPDAQTFVPRILRRDEHTLRAYFCSQPKTEQATTWYRDFDLRTETFAGTIHRVKLKTQAGVFDMEPRHFHADAAAQGFKRPAVNHGLYLFDSFKVFDGRMYVAINNFPGKQNALALMHDDQATVEVLGHYNEPQTESLSESSVNRLPDGTWMAICRNDSGNYHFTTSRDGRSWSVGAQRGFIPNGLNSKPTFDRFAGVYYMGWQENTRFGDCGRSVFNVEVSLDGQTWQRKYRFETPHSFQYPTLHEHDGEVWLSVTQSDHGGTSDRIMFGKLERTGAFEDQRGQKRIAWPAAKPLDPPVMRRGVRLFTDRDYVIDEVPAGLQERVFHRTSIEKMDVTVTRAGVLFALTPSLRPRAASQEDALRKAGFSKVDQPESQLFPGEINRVALFRKEVKVGDRLQFNKMVLLVLSDGAAVKEVDGMSPSVLMDPGAAFQDDARPGAMIIGMDRTAKGRIWGCWTGTGDKADGYFLLSTSDDGGESWSKPRLAVGARTGSGQKVCGALVGNVWTDPRGRVWLFFDQQLGDVQKRITNWFIRCDDPDAEHPQWTDPVMFAEGCTLNKPTVLKNGEWLLPVSDWHRKTARVFFSNDEGASWSERGHLQFPDWEFDEHMMVELRDGRVWMLARTKGQPHESFSSDGGRSWSEPAPAATVQNVNARFFLRRLKSGRILLVKNGSPEERLKKRTHMSAWLSEDEGRTWKGGLVLDERDAVSYPDGFESADGSIHILYDWNRHTDAEILMARFREEDVLAGKVVSEGANLRMLANKATGAKPEVLYNGIQLPSTWPPSFRDPRSAEPMEVPYLKERDGRVGPQLAGGLPKVIPIDVGRQLFVDDFLIERSTLTRKFHKAKKYEGNPVFKPETRDELAPSVEGEKGEEATLFTGQGGIFYDPADGLFKLFHVAGWRGALSVATSSDMVHWSRPDLGAGRGNHLLERGLQWKGASLRSGGSDNCVWLDLNAPEAERIKYLTCWMHVDKALRPNGFNHSLHVSDGTRWSDGIPTTMAADDYCSFFFNPFRKKWCFSIKRGTVRGRSRYYFESDSFMKGADWDRAVYWTASDRLDCPEVEGVYPGAGDVPQLYSLNAVAYESVMVGMHYIHRGPKNEVCDVGKFPKLVDLELGFSRDGFHWDRPDRSGFISGSRVEGAWDRGYLHGAAGMFVVKGDELVFPYMGTSGVAPSGVRGMYTGGSIGLATLRRDGFASVEGSGELLTRPVRFSGSHCFVNLNGSLQVEVIAVDDSVICSSPVISGDSTRMRVPLDGLAQGAGKPVRFRFKLLNGALYSFWVTRDSDGASFGYVGAGGPDYGGTKDDRAGRGR